MSNGAPSPPAGQARRRVAIIAAAAVAVAAAGGVGLAAALRSGSGGSSPAPVADRTPTGTPTGGSASPPTGTASAPSTASPAGAAFAYQPLWPFRDVAEAQSWQARARAAGTGTAAADAWHFDASATALAFTRDFLGFTDVGTVVASTVTATDARVSVGSRLGNGRDATAAVLHLARLGSGPSAPWEVVGTDDATLSLTAPAYGAAATSPVIVSGRITGVDESLRISVRQPSSAAPIGGMCCLAAGGDNTPWSTPVSFSGAVDPVLTIVVSSGGHVSTVERFAVTGIRRPPTTSATPGATG
jgi:hypothetical protein